MKEFRKNISKLASLVLLLFLVLYAMRFYWVESRREYSQEGVLGVLLGVAPEIREERVNHGTSGIGCGYAWRLQHCIGIELGYAASTVPNLPERFRHMVNNFCAIVEEKYPRGVYDAELRPQLREFSMGLSQAYSIYFDCENSRKPIGEVRLYISNKAETTGEPNKARLIVKI